MNFYNDPVKVDEYEKMCEEYDGTALYSILEKHLDKGASLLELGSGPGKDLDHFKMNYSVTGSDMSDEFVSRGKARLENVPFIKLDAVSINTDAMYDCLFSNKVLHHLKRDELNNSLKRQ